MRKALLAVLVLLAFPAAGQAWDGTNPFTCEVQDAGLGATVPHPEADPYCVRFDKTQQTILPDFGLLTFLSLEPARTAAALPKCQYYQEDHWRATVIRDNGATDLYEWEGHYFFDKGTANGGVFLTNVRINGHLSPFYGGGRTLDNLPGDPRCPRDGAAPSLVGLKLGLFRQPNCSCTSNQRAKRARPHPPDSCVSNRVAKGARPRSPRSCSRN